MGRQILADFPVHFTKDIPHLIQDRLNQMDAFYRTSDMARVVFEAAIVEKYRGRRANGRRRFALLRYR